MIANFKLTGLQRVDGDIYATCEAFNNEDRFQAKIHGSKIDKEKMWKYVKGNWEDFIANVKFKDIKNGIPVDAIVMFIQHK